MKQVGVRQRRWVLVQSQVLAGLRMKAHCILRQGPAMDVPRADPAMDVPRPDPAMDMPRKESHLLR